MIVQALSAGEGFPRDFFDGQVHSVFDSAANLSLADAGLVTLLAARSGNLPRGARLDTPPGYSFEDHLEPGLAATCREGILSFSGSTFAVDLRPARVWQSDLKTLAIDLSLTQAMAGWRIALAGLRQHPGTRTGIAGAVFDLDAAGAPSPLVRAARGPIHALADAALRFDVAGSAVAAGKLIGLGPGLTPSGDDFLVGFMSGLWACAADNLYRIAFTDGLGLEISRFAGRTTDISRAFLLDAARGEASEPLTALATAIRDGVEVDVREAAQVALGVGSASGVDGVAGLLAGLSMWQTMDR
jgi:hypothetical protein